MKLQKIVSTAFFLAFAMSQSLATAQLTADFSLDTSGFFNNATARSAVEAAIADLNAALNQNLNAITASDVTVTGAFQAETVTFSLTSSVRNPSTGVDVDVSPVSAQSVVRIFVGARDLGSSVLGFGGPGANGLGASAQAISNLSDFGVAVTNGAALASAVNQRGGGPLISRLSTAFEVGGSTFPFQIDYGLVNGNIAFDNDLSRFHLDHTTTPAANRSDLYSVALHEAMHALGMGPSDAWDNHVNGTTWTGSEVADLLGSGAGAVFADGNHVARNLLTPRITDGVLQESVLISVIPTGTRIALTELDLAFMRDIGFEGAVVPPRPPLAGDFDLDGDVDLADLDRYNSNLGASATGSLAALDLNGNGTVDATDFETHYSTLVRTSNGNSGTVLGDINLDGAVDVLGDAFVLVANLGNNSATSWGQGDLNADGLVNVLGDAFMLVANLGAVSVQSITVAAERSSTTENSVSCGCGCCSQK